jgi:hypothetical protein
MEDDARENILAGARQTQGPDGRRGRRPAAGTFPRAAALDLAGGDRSDATALIKAARRVRNNLFHGGKEEPGDQPFDGDDDEWGRAALDVAEILLDLVDNDAFGPPKPRSLTVGQTTLANAHEADCPGQRQIRPRREGHGVIDLAILETHADQTTPACPRFPS